jgi:hypothetical protein
MTGGITLADESVRVESEQSMREIEFYLDR